MLKLRQLDNQQSAASLPSRRGYGGAEERRPAWWVAFLADRHLRSTTGWPCLIDERHVCTNLPTAEDVFASTTADPYPTSLSGGLRRIEQDVDEQVSPFAIRILAANNLLHALDHITSGSPEATFLHGRFTWASWDDVEELIKGGVKEQLERDIKFLRVGVFGLRGRDVALDV